MTADEIIAAARSMIGTPFHHQGRQPGVGLDCGGLVVAVCRRLGIDCADMDGYGRRPHDGMMEALLDRQACLVRLPLQDMGPGDLALMRFATEPQHLAILAHGTVIHAYESVGGVVEHVLDTAWRRRIVRAYRFVEVG